MDFYFYFVDIIVAAIIIVIIIYSFYTRGGYEPIEDNKYYCNYYSSFYPKLQISGKCKIILGRLQLVSFFIIVILLPEGWNQEGMVNYFKQGRMRFWDGEFSQMPGSWKLRRKATECTLDCNSCRNTLEEERLGVYRNPGQMATQAGRELQSLVVDWAKYLKSKRDELVRENY